MKIRNAKLFYARTLVGELEIEDEGTTYIIKVDEILYSEVILSSNPPLPEHLRALAINHVIGWLE